MVEPLFRFPRKGKGKQAEPYACRCDILNDDGVIELEEVLEMCDHVLTWQTMELVFLHYRDEASAELKVFGPSVDNGLGGHVGHVGNRVLSDLAIAVVADWCSMMIDFYKILYMYLYSFF